MRERRLFLLVWLFAGQTMAQLLPVHVEESHAGAFYHLVETLPLKEPHTLVLIDAHCDANGIASSDEIRTAIRRGPTLEKRAEMLAQWREEGRVQCFNWIEPLMPAPIAEVIWIPAARLTEENGRPWRRTRGSTWMATRRLGHERQGRWRRGTECAVWRILLKKRRDGRRAGMWRRALIWIISRRWRTVIWLRNWRE